MPEKVQWTYTKQNTGQLLINLNITSPSGNKKKCLHKSKLILHFFNKQITPKKTPSIAPSTSCEVSRETNQHSVN